MRNFLWASKMRRFGVLVLGRPQHRFEDEDENAEDEDDSQMSVIVIAANCT